MSQLKSPLPVKPFFAVFSADRTRIEQAARRLEGLVGPLDYISEEFPFDWTDYYEREMGGPLIKRFFSAESLVDPSELVDIKVTTNGWEQEWSIEGVRTVNLDPGYLSSERLVLTTGKDAAHRIYLGRGVFADLSLIFRFGEFKTLPWTYADYASVQVRQLAAEIRKKYLDQLKAGRWKEQ